MKISKTILGVLLTFVICSGAWGQTLASSQISGDITDQTGAAVPNAQIKLIQTDTAQTHLAKSGPSGSYIIPDLPAGPYRLEVTLAGFSTYVQQGIVLEIGSNPQINAKLAVGSIDQKVVVEATALAVESISTGVGQVINQEQVVEMPLNGRDPTALIALAGATTTAPSGDLNSNKNFPTITIAVAGGLPNGVAYILDGGSHNDPFNNLNLPIPFPDALQEFKVETSSLPAQYGDHAAAAVNAITKSGGNKFHGDAFEFVRNYLFNAANFFGYNASTGAKVRDSLKRNQFGGVIGGPIIKDKLFFFAGYQEDLVRSDPPGTFTYVPTTAMLAGDFSTVTSTTCQKSAITLGAPFANVGGKPNQINPGLFSPQALTALKDIPVATSANDTTAGCGYIEAKVPASYNEAEGIGRVDYTLSEKHRIFGRYFFGIYNQPVPLVPGNALATNGVAQYNRDSTLTVGDTYSFTANLFNAVHLTGRRTIGKRIVDPFFDPSTLGINAYTNIHGFLGLAVTNGFSLGGGTTNPGYFNSTSWQAIDDVSWIHGKHEISVGIDYVYALMDSVNNRPSNGTYTFSGAALSSNGSYGYADFFTGTLDTFAQGNADLENDGQTYFGAYAQDSWKATRRLTVNYGLRWEPYTPEHNSNGHVENFNMANFTAGKVSSVYTAAPAGLSFMGDAGYPTNHYTFGKKTDFEPRVGLIFDPMGDGKMTIRGSYGIFYDTPQMFFDTRYSNSPPFGDTVSLTGPISFANPWATYPGGNPFPALDTAPKSAALPLEGVYVNTPLHPKPMYLQQWNLSLQRQVSSWLFGATYLGNTTKHLTASYEADPAIYISGTSTGAAGSCGPVMTTTALGLPKAGAACSSTGNTNNRRVLYQQNPAQGMYYSTIGTLDDGGVANYNGMLLSAQHRSKNFNLVLNFTWAHCLSEAETTELTGPSYLVPPAYNGNGRQLSYSNCDSDHRKVLNSTFTAYTPRLSERIANLLVHGWELSTIFTATSGGFGTATLPSDTALNGESGQIANVVSNPYTGARARFGATNYITATAFAAPAIGTLSAQTPLTLHLPGSYELDMNLARNFKVPHTDSQNVQFRWEVFNVTNEAIFTGSPAGSISSSTFGQFTTAGNPRIMQLALKYNF